MKGKTEEWKEIVANMLLMTARNVKPGAHSIPSMKTYSQGIEYRHWLVSGMLGIWNGCCQPRLPPVVVQPKLQGIGSKGSLVPLQGSMLLAGGVFALKDSRSLPNTSATDLDERA